MGGWAGARLVSRAGWAAGGRGGGAPGRVIGERCGVDATAGGVRSVAVGTVAQDPWYFKAYDGFSRHVATFRGADASPKEIYTHHEMNDGGSQLAVRRDVDATGGGGWGGSSDGVLETQAHLLHRANGDVIAVVGGLKDTGSVTRPGAVRERMEFVPGGDGAGSVEPMRLSPSDGYQIGGARGADGLVTGDDYNAWIAEYAAGTANSATDLNNNGVVDGDDFTAWNAEWDSGAPVGRAIMSVPDGADFKGPGNVRGAMAAAGVALDAVLSGKVSGGSGQTGRVRWLSSAAGEVNSIAAAADAAQANEPWRPRPEFWRPMKVPCLLDTESAYCRIECGREGHKWFGRVFPNDFGQPVRCCICTAAIKYWLPDIAPYPNVGPNPPFEQYPEWDEGYRAMLACVIAEEVRHTQQCGGSFDCNECDAKLTKLACLGEQYHRCKSDYCRQVVDAEIERARRQKERHCDRCYASWPVLEWPAPCPGVSNW